MGSNHQAGISLQKCRIVFYLLSILILLIACVKVSSFSTAYWLDVLLEYLVFFPIGFLAAIMANSTGVGGGVVFLPAFMVLGLSPEEALATSIAIQCFGMSSGALSWLTLRHSERHSLHDQWQCFPKIMWISLLATVIGLWIVQWQTVLPPTDIKKLFSYFSLLVAAAIFARTLYFQEGKAGRSSPLTLSDTLIVFAACVLGGFITAWISIGVGEILAVVLILMGFRVHLAIASAVCISSLTVILAVPYHIFVTEKIEYNILLFAGAAALMGGAVAKNLAIRIGPIRLKYFMAVWIAFSAIVTLVS